MLEVTTSSQPGARVNNRVRVITALNLAKARRAPGERAALAAAWMQRRLDIGERTTALAAKIFGCSQGAVHGALAGTERPAADAA